MLSQQPRVLNVYYNFISNATTQARPSVFKTYFGYIIVTVVCRPCKTPDNTSTTIWDRTVGGSVFATMLAHGVLLHVVHFIKPSRKIWLLETFLFSFSHLLT